MEKVCQRDGKQVLLFQSFKGKGDVMDCGA